MKRPGDTRPEPPGGRAAERLREHERARQPIVTDHEPVPSAKRPGRRRPARPPSERGGRPPDRQ
ncbi:MAG: hypothetical protein IT181_06030 [Acidobacteria bacterium]|nr:hypothetical protein [Acidobacteriota bacterium]